MGQNGAKRDQNGLISLVCAAQMVWNDIHEKGALTGFFDPKRCRFKTYWDFPGSKMCDHMLNTGQRHLFEHPTWCEKNFGKKDSPREPSWPHCWLPMCMAQAALLLQLLTNSTWV